MIGFGAVFCTVVVPTVIYGAAIAIVRLIELDMQLTSQSLELLFASKGLMLFLFLQYLVAIIIVGRFCMRREERVARTPSNEDLIKNELHWGC